MDRKFKHSLLTAFLGAAVIFSLLSANGCSTAAPPAQAEVQPAKKVIRTGLYVDRGSAGGGVVRLARIIEFSPELELHLLVGQDLRDGKLKDLDLLVIPGGDSDQQYESMQESGAEAVRKFVAEGGSYYGVCAGFHCTLYKPRRIGLLPFTHLKGGYGLRAPLVIDISEKGRKLLDLPAKRYTVTYSQGPVAIPCEQPGTGWGEQLAVYVNSVSSLNRPKFNFSGTPSIIHGQYGKGKVIATSFHPEYLKSTHVIAFGCIGAVTGVKPKPVYPVKRWRPVRVWFNTNSLSREKIRQALELEHQTDIEVNYDALSAGAEEHVDVMIITDGAEKVMDSFMKKNQALLVEFMDRGGKVIVTGAAAKSAPKHKNLTVFPVTASLPEAVRQVCR
ncbi:MAG: hypothetical protein J5806_14225 [Lentisphaeria bacterium]|nr:hypothetical protein [Lentisphaeria bacterium]